MSTSSTYRVPLEMLVSQLNDLRAKHGDKAYQAAVLDLATSMILKPNGETFLRNAFPDLDLAPIKAKALLQEADVTDPVAGATPEQAMLNMLRQQVPSIRTQAQYNTFLTAFDAFRTMFDGYFSGNLDRANRARNAMNKTLDVAAQINDLADKLQEIPEEERSEQANTFIAEPKEFHEYDTQRALLVQLGGLSTMAELSDWYAATKPQRDSIVSQALRNELIDRIRNLRLELQAKEAN